MTCPRCGETEIMRTAKRERAGYTAAIFCETCERQVCVIREEPGDAIDAAEKLFFGNGGRDG